VIYVSYLSLYTESLEGHLIPTHTLYLIHSLMSQNLQVIYISCEMKFPSVFCYRFVTVGT
jgi:hypothetical protein